MTRQIVGPEQLDMESPGRRDYWVALGHTSVWGSHLIPLTVIVGPQANPGEGLVAFGANHGNEYEGPVAIKHLLRQIRIEEVLGRIVLVPVLNVAAFRVGARESTGDDGFNLNRVFVEGAGTTPAMAGITHRIAAFVRQSIWPHVHIVIDLHSGGEVARFAHWVGFFTCAASELNQRREQMARWFGVPVVTAGPNGPPGGILGGLHGDADHHGKYAIGTELGHGSSVDVRGVRYARQGVLAAAIHHGLLKGKIEPIAHHADGTQRLVRIGASVAAPYPGHYEPLVDCGERVVRGQTVGLLHDFYRLDEDPFEVVAAVAGIVVSQAWGARVAQGQMIMMVAEEIG
ncbi:MAG: succinylglutamate desuccinylase/aspartoacylase family protein [Candidatus Handelsmanbacteria bacterium]|nr:succinylglutamate desuccinylase/aspartoacylase family protein [Candidatus Handelsmanbacteria bacterium]